MFAQLGLSGGNVVNLKSSESRDETGTDKTLWGTLLLPGKRCESEISQDGSKLLAPHLKSHTSLPHRPTLLIGLEVHCFYHDKIMPVNLCICHPFLLLFLLFLLPLSLLELGPLHPVTHLKRQEMA